MKKTMILSLIILLTTNISASAGWLNWLSKIGNNASDLGKAGDVTPAPMVKKLETSTTSVPNAPDDVKISGCGVDCFFWYYEGATIPLKISRSIDRANKCQFSAKVTSFNSVVYSHPDEKSEPVSYYEQDREVCILQQGTGTKIKTGELQIENTRWYKTNHGWVKNIDFGHKLENVDQEGFGMPKGTNPAIALEWLKHLKSQGRISDEAFLNATTTKSPP